jgi:hypothetical protein
MADIEEDQQPKTADVRRVAITGAVLIAVLILLVWVAYGLDVLFSERYPGGRFPQAGEPTQIPPPPRLQATPTTERLAHLKEQRKRLDSWGWVDRPKGIAHIPIEEAMRLKLKNSSPEEQ